MNQSIFSFVCALLCAATLSAATVNVTPGSSTIKTAVTNAVAGDVLVLTDGEYTESSHVKPTVALTIKAADGTHPVVKLNGCRFEPTADLILQGLTLQCTAEAVRLDSADVPYSLTVKDCEISGCPSYYIRLYNTR